MQQRDAERRRPSANNSSYPLAVGGSPARYGTDNGVTIVTIVSVVVDSTTGMDVQLPVTAPVTRSRP